MPTLVVRISASTCAGVVAFGALSGCGRYPDPADPPEPRGQTTPRPAWTPGPDGLTVVSCEDVPPIPKDKEVQVARSSPGGAEAILVWTDDSGAESATRQYVIRVDDPACAKRPDIRVWLERRGRRPRFENARIVVQPGQDRAYVGYTIIGLGENQFANPDDVRGFSSDGRPVRWRHQTETGGPADITAIAGRHVVIPGSPESGDADYVDASKVKVGQTVTFMFFFETGAVQVPFEVVAAE